MTEEVKKIVSDEIRMQRCKNRISQESMAKALKMSIPTYRELESNPNRITLEQGTAINEILNWNLYDFYLSEVLQKVTFRKGE